MLNLGEAETLVYDVTDAIFLRSREAYLYITRDDTYLEGFIITIPVISFSYVVKTSHQEQDLQRLLKDETNLPDRILRENLTKSIREAIKEF